MLGKDRLALPSRCTEWRKRHWPRLPELHDGKTTTRLESEPSSAGVEETLHAPEKVSFFVLRLKYLLIWMHCV